MKNIKIIPFALSTLVAGPTLVSAQTQNAPVRVAKAPQEPMPKAQELLDNLFAPYAVAKTFSGNFDIFIKSKEQSQPIEEYRLRTAFRFDDEGNLERQNTKMTVVGRAEPKERQTFQFVDDGRTNTVVFVDQKSWALKEPRDTSTALVNTLKSALDASTVALHNSPGFVPIISKGLDAGRPVWILKAKGSNAVRIVVDAKTRALRSFDILDEDQRVSIRGSEQVFDEPIADEAFVWTPPADFKNVAADDIHLPPTLGIVVTTTVDAATPIG